MADDTPTWPFTHSTVPFSGSNPTPGLSERKVCCEIENILWKATHREVKHTTEDLVGIGPKG